MVRVITQETYDEVVKENIEEFDMTPEEAIKEATAQFEAQGVDLTNIIKDLSLGGADHLVSTIVADLKDLSSQGANDEEIMMKLEALKTECEKDLAHRVRAAKDGAYNTLIELIEARQKIFSNSKSEQDGKFIVLVLNTLNALMDVQPDLLDERGVDFIMSTLNNTNNQEVLTATLQWASTCCIKHEMNRQRLFGRNIGDNLKVLMKDQKNAKLLSESLQVVRKLTLDDDVRVEFGKAHDHARELGMKLLEILTDLLNEYKKPPLVSELMLTISSLLVRNELCAAAENAVTNLQGALADSGCNAAVSQRAYTLLTALAGNDDVKRKIMATDLPYMIVSTLNRHVNNPTSSALGLKCISALCLREPTHSVTFIDNGACDAIVACMNQHRDVASVQKNACWAIRNMVARCKEQNTKFLELGVEELLNEAYKKFDKDFGFDIKSALRDLECDVKLDEQWTGKGVQMDY